MTSRAFSLIELLVVVAIIALLAGMLMPTLSLVRHSARQSTCASGLRQCFLAASAYTGDWDGMLPPVVGAVGVTWQAALSPYVELETARWDFAAGVAPVFRSCKVPWTNPMAAIDPRNNLNTGYAMNDTPGMPGSAVHTCIWRFNAAPDQYRTFAVASLGQPASRLLLADGDDRRMCVFSAPSPRLALNRHRGRANGLFCDGHAGTLPASAQANALLAIDDPASFRAP